MSSFKNADAGVIVDQLIKTIQKERDYLSEIDGKIGDCLLYTSPSPRD